MSEPTLDSTQRLVREIRTAFSTTKVPALIATHPDDWDGARLEETFGGRRWTDITASDIAEHKDDHLQFTLIALLYYLPAFLVHSLLEPDLTDVALEATGMFLSPRVLDGVYGPTTSVGLSTLPRRQRSAIRHYLEYAQLVAPYAVKPESVAFWAQ